VYNQLPRSRLATAARSARRRLLSRFNAATQLPQALRHREPSAVRSLLRQALR
jgi:hypothetical protein